MARPFPAPRARPPLATQQTRAHKNDGAWSDTQKKIVRIISKMNSPFTPKSKQKSVKGKRVIKLVRLGEGCFMGCETVRGEHESGERKFWFPLVKGRARRFAEFDSF